MPKTWVLLGDCLTFLKREVLLQLGIADEVCLTFLDPPFKQGKDYDYFDDDMPEESYWQWITQVCSQVYDLTAEGGAIYFMHEGRVAHGDAHRPRAGHPLLSDDDVRTH